MTVPQTLTTHPNPAKIHGLPRGFTAKVMALVGGAAQRAAEQRDMRKLVFQALGVPTDPPTPAATTAAAGVGTASLAAAGTDGNATSAPKKRGAPRLQRAGGGSSGRLVLGVEGDEDKHSLRYHRSKLSLSDLLDRKVMKAGNLINAADHSR